MFSFKNVFVLMLIVVMALIPAVVLAQDLSQPQLETIRIIVRDAETGARVIHANMIIHVSGSSTYTVNATTDDNGDYQITVELRSQLTIVPNFSTCNARWHYKVPGVTAHPAQYAFPVIANGCKIYMPAIEKSR